MFNIQIIALIALFFRITSDIYIGVVLTKQYRFYKLPGSSELNDQINKEVKHYRLILLRLSAGIFIGNLIPIILDIATILFSGAGRPHSVSLPSATYVESNAITSFLSAYFIRSLYRLSADTKAVTDLTQHTLESENKELRKNQ